MWWRRRWLRIPVWAWLSVLAVFVAAGALGDPATDDTTTAPTTPAPTAPPAVASSTTSASMQPATTAPESTAPASTAAPTTPAAVTSVPATTAPVPTTVDPVVEVAASQLVALVVADPDPARTPYERDDYDRDGWGDLDGDCISTRHELLIAYSVDQPVIDGCQVTSGRWIDPYDGTVYMAATDVQIDHLIPLAEAHRAGAWRWDLDTRYRFTNDETPGHLLVVGDASNQSKADSTPDKWLPADPDAHCQYAIDWIAAKSRWQLTITGDELVALNAVLGRCTPTSSLRPAVTVEPPVVVITTPTTTTTTTIAPAAGPGIVALLACDKRNEAVTIGNTGGAPVNLSGYTLHDEERNHETGLGGFGSLQPGRQLVILTGPDAVGGSGTVVWKNQNVWNNDGDTAYLIAPDGTVATRAC